MMRFLILCCVLLFGSFASVTEARPTAPMPAPAKAKIFLTVDEALALVFPDCEVEQRTAYLTKAERARVKKIGRVEVPQSMLRYYVGRKDGRLVGTAYIEAHKVRTLKETVLVLIDPEAKIRRFEILSFAEPTEYIPRDTWYAQLIGCGLEDDVELNRGIRGVSGATLTARAATRSARRVLALHSVLQVTVAE